MEEFIHGLWHALKDTLIVIPILYLAYLLVSYFSHNDNEKYSKILRKTNKAGPVIGAFLGCVPQCGFSSVMSQLYSKKLVTFGTLIAVFIATSDEAIPLMISKPEFIPKLLLLIAIKVVYGIIIGYFLDLFIHLFSKRKKSVLNDEVKISHDEHSDNEIDSKDIQECSTVHGNCCYHVHDEHHKHEESNKHEDDKDEQNHKHSCQCHHSHEKEGGHKHSHAHCCATNIFLDALKHTLIIAAYVFVATLIIELVKEYCGGLEPLQNILTNNVYIQILLASLIGLIPNCASSVFLVEMFMEGVLLFPALVAGLTAGAGVGLIVLFTANYKRTWINISIVGLQYILALLIGIIINFIPIW